jgi:hypothetical protein
MERPEERLALIEQYERDGHVARIVDVRQWPVTLGRALDNHVVIDDPHLAPYHARLALAEGGALQLQALPSRNGVEFNDRLVAGTVAVPSGGGVLQLGATRLRLRLAGETLAPEKPLAAGGRGGALAPVLTGAAVFALLLATHALALDPGADYSAWLPPLMGLPGAVALWCALWALMSKLFQHRFDFIGHLRIVLPWLLAMMLTDALWPLATSAMAAPLLWKLGGLLQAVLLALLVRAHLAHLLPLHQRAVTATVAIFALGGGALSAALTYRNTDSLFAAPYMSTLPMPALRLAGTVPSATLVQDMAPLAEKLAERVRKSRADDDGADDAGD